jgi:hypothetical protein
MAISGGLAAGAYFAGTGVTGVALGVAEGALVGAAAKKGVNSITQTPKIKAPEAVPMPQMSKAPDLNAIRNSQAGPGQAGGSPGVAQTFLTGAGGVDPSTLTLGRTLLLGN